MCSVRGPGYLTHIPNESRMERRDLCHRFKVAGDLVWVSEDRSPFRSTRQDKYVHRPVLHRCEVLRATTKRKLEVLSTWCKLLLPSFAGSTGGRRCAHTALGTLGTEPTFWKRLLQVHAGKVELCTDMVSTCNPWSNDDRDTAILGAVTYPLVRTVRVVTCDHFAVAEFLAETIQLLVITVVAFLALALLAFAFFNCLSFFTKVEVYIIDFG